MTPCSSVAELRDMIQSRFTPDYVKKMMHMVPEWPSIKERGDYLEKKASGTVVLDIGCTGKLSKRIHAAAATYYGVDNQAGAWAVVDLDKDPSSLPVYADVNVVIASEIIEHLSNPGRFLDALAEKYRGIETYITVPNAGAYTVVDECEMVNKDHVAWYSYTTLSTLLDRSGYVLEDCVWYNGQPHKAEGILMKVRA